MPRIPVGKCSSCGAAVSYFARSCPRCHAANLPNPVATVAALLLVAAVGGAIVFGARAISWSKRTPQSAPQTAAVEDYGWIVKAMAECDEVAKRAADVMHFLILPLTPTGKILAGWAPATISTVGDWIDLVSATDALIGLRNDVLTLYPKEVTFAVSDPKTNTVYKWKPAVGVSELTTRETGLESLRLGFQVADIGSEITWGPTIKVAVGNCYWTNPIIRPAKRQ
jgi:hypothetical protein